MKGQQEDNIKNIFKYVIWRTEVNSAELGGFMTSFCEHVIELPVSIKAENPLQDEYWTLKEDSVRWYLLLG